MVTLEARKFAKDETIVKIEKRPFTCGAMRHCFRVSRSAPGEASFRANSDARWRRLARAPSRRISIERAARGLGEPGRNACEYAGQAE